MKRGEIVRHPAVAIEERAKIRKKEQTIRLRKALKEWRAFKEWSAPEDAKDGEGVWCPPCPDHQPTGGSPRTCKRCGWEYEHHYPLPWA